MSIEDEIIEGLRAIGFNDRQVLDAWRVVSKVVKDAEVLRERRKKDAEAQKARRNSLPKPLEKSSPSVDVLRQKQEESWRMKLERYERTGEWPYKSARPGAGGCDIPAAFIEQWKAERKIGAG